MDRSADAPAKPSSSVIADVSLPTTSAWGTVFLLSSFYVLSVLDRNLLSLLAQPIKRDLGLTDTQIGVLYGAAFSLFYVTAAMPIGWAIDRYSRRGIIWAGTVVWSLGTMASGFGTGFASLFAARAVVGAGEATISPGSHSILADSFPREKLSLPMSVYSTGAKLGSGLSFLLGGLLTAVIDPDLEYNLAVIGVIKGWKVIFLIAGAPGIVFAFLIYTIREPARKVTFVKSDKTPGQFIPFLKSNWVLLLAHHVATMLLFATMAALVIWAPAFLERAYGLHSSEAGLWLSLVLTVGPVAAMPLHGILVDRAFARGSLGVHMRYVLIMVVVATPFAIGAYLLPTAWASLVSLALAATLLSGYVALPPSALQLIVQPLFRAKAAALLMIFQSGGTVLGSALPAIINDRFFGCPETIGQSVSIAVAVMLPISGILCWIASRRMGLLLGRVAA